jgi:hypothetical protein
VACPSSIAVPPIGAAFVTAVNSFLFTMAMFQGHTTVFAGIAISTVCICHNFNITPATERFDGVGGEPNGFADCFVSVAFMSHIYDGLF